MPANPQLARALLDELRMYAAALLIAAALWGVLLLALHAWADDPCTVDSIDGPLPCRSTP